MSKEIRREVVKITEKEHEALENLLWKESEWLSMELDNKNFTKQELKDLKKDLTIIEGLTDKWEKLGVKWEKIKEGQHRASINGAEHWLLSIEDPETIMERNRNNGHAKNSDMTKLRDRILGSETISGGRKKGSVSTRIIREIFSEFS